RYQSDAPSATDLWKFLLQLAGNRFRFGIRLLQAYLGTKFCYNVVVRRCALGKRKIVDVRLQGEPDFSRAREIETRRHDSHNAVAAPFKIRCAANNILFPAEMVLPESVANQHDAWVAGAILFRRKTASDDRVHSQCRQIICHDRGATNPFRFAASSQIE